MPDNININLYDISYVTQHVYNLLTTPPDRSRCDFQPSTIVSSFMFANWPLSILTSVKLAYRIFF